MVSYTTSIIDILSSVTNLKQISRLMKIFIITPNLVDNSQSAPLVWQILPHVNNNCISILMNIFTPPPFFFLQPVRNRNRYPSRASGFIPCVLVGSVQLIFLVFCVVQCMFSCLFHPVSCIPNDSGSLLRFSLVYLNFISHRFGNQTLRNI